MGSLGEAAGARDASYLSSNKGQDRSTERISIQAPGESAEYRYANPAILRFLHVVAGTIDLFAEVEPAEEWLCIPGRWETSWATVWFYWMELFWIHKHFYGDINELHLS